MKLNRASFTTRRKSTVYPGAFPDGMRTQRAPKKRKIRMNYSSPVQRESASARRRYPLTRR